MSLLTNKIDDFEFVALLGDVLPVEMQLAIDNRPGVSGTQFTQQGAWGEPFELVSQVDAVDWPSARQLLAGYAALTQGDPVGITQNDYDYRAQEGLLFQVLKVTPRKIKALGAAIGGLNPPSGAWVEAVWQLVAVAQPPS